MFVSALEQLEDRIEGIRAGGDDYLVKPVRRDLLVAAVRAQVEKARLLAGLIDHDGLTQLLAREAFSPGSEPLAARRQRNPGAGAALVLVDVDHFKQVNDSHGHAAGDRVLVTLDRLLERRLRHGDLVGRYGGDEFALLLDEVSAERAVRLVERVLAEFGEVEHVSCDGSRFRAAFTAGVAAFDPLAPEVERWSERADGALLLAKEVAGIEWPPRPRERRLRNTAGAACAQTWLAWRLDGPVAARRNTGARRAPLRDGQEGPRAGDRLPGPELTKRSG